MVAVVVVLLLYRRRWWGRGEGEEEDEVRWFGLALLGEVGVVRVLL